MSGQHCESYDVKRETVHCYPVNSSLLTAVARDGWNLSAVFKFCFCFVLLYNKSLNDWSRGDSEFCFPRISMLPSTSSRETLRFSGNKIHCSPRDQSLSPTALNLRSVFKTHLKAHWLSCFHRGWRKENYSPERFEGFVHVDLPILRPP